MPKPTILIIHGIGGHAGIHWQQWAHDYLVENGFEVLMPNMSRPNHPDRKTWLKEVKKAVEGVDLSQLTVVGHSLGVVTALDFIEQLDKPIKGLIAVSGFATDYGAELNSYFMKEKNIDFEKVNKNLENATVIYGDDDPYVTQDALYFVADKLKVEPKIIHKGGHLNTEAGFTKFPGLINNNDFIS
jgi:predicted alpha/beta hydrolase family esterase